jgi:hypothetical protein
MSDLNLPVSIIVKIIVPYSTYNSTYDVHVHDLKTSRHEQNFSHLKQNGEYVNLNQFFYCVKKFIQNLMLKF